jgi:hypothetical protein
MIHLTVIRSFNEHRAVGKEREGAGDIEGCSTMAYEMAFTPGRQFSDLVFLDSLLENNLHSHLFAALPMNGLFNNGEFSFTQHFIRDGVVSFDSFPEKVEV